MSNFALSCLHACQELVSHQKELVFLLAKTLDIQSEEVLYSWALRKVDQIGVIYDTNWQYFFHGLGCNIENIEDGRLLPVSFGPGGRVDTFTSSSVLQFIMTSKAPWQEFPDLRTYLAKHEPPYHKHSGSHQRMSMLWKRMQESGFIEIADSQLTSTSRDPFAVWAERPNSLHPYVYAGTNPINWLDPSGACYGPFRSFRNVEFTKCRDLDKARYIWYSPRASASQKALAFASISLWSFGAVAGVAAVPVSSAAAASAAGATSGTLAVAAAFGAGFDLIAQRVTQGSWERVDGLQTIFSASTGMLGAGVGAFNATQVQSFWGRVVSDSIGSGIVGGAMTYLGNLFSCAPTDIRQAMLWSAVLGGAGSGIGQKLEMASAAQAKRLKLHESLFMTRKDRQMAFLGSYMGRIQVPREPSPFAVGAGTVVGNAIANTSPLGKVFEFMIAPEERFDPTPREQNTPLPSPHTIR
ncbi:MAG: hypothetical protein MI924_29480 [Chloroflexales bacterium]|nr:hypothetical protein [Chloroflexales bacterium]